MKQKNMILIAVAVVCGLIAAFLTSQMSARTKNKPAVETVDVPVAKKEIPTGTKLKPEEFDQYVELKKMPKESLPPAFIEDVQMLKDKRVMRVMRQGDVFNPADINGNNPLNLPAGYDLMAVPCTVTEAVAGLIEPGVKVNVIASVQMKKSQQQIVFPLFTDLLVMAVNSEVAKPKDGSAAYATVSMVSFAVDGETALLFQGAISRGAQMRLTLKHQDKESQAKYPTLTHDQIWDILSGRSEEKESRAAETAKEAAKVEIVKVKVPKMDIPAGTEITKEFLERSFDEVEYPKKSVPDNVERDWTARLENKDFFLKDVAARHFVPKNFLGQQPQEAAGPKKAGPDDGASSEKTAPPEDKAIPAPPKPEYVDVTVNTVKGTVRHRYIKYPNGEHKYLGVITDGTEPEEKREEKKPSEEPKTSPIQ